MNRVFGKFVPKNNIINKLDCRIKLFSLVALMVVVFLNYGDFMNSFLILGIVLFLTIFLMLISKTSILKFITSLKSLWFMMIFLMIINCLIPYGDYTHVLKEFKSGFCIYYESVFNALRVFIRLVLMIALTMIFTTTSSPLDITYAFEWYLTPLKIFKLPTQVISMTMSLALRFIPTLLEEAERIMMAQKSRGVDYSDGFFKKKIKSISTLIIPLLVSCFKRSDELALAMDARGYDPYSKRSKYRELKFKRVDLFAIILVLIILGLFIFLSIISSKYGFNFLENIFKTRGTF